MATITEWLKWLFCLLTFLLTFFCCSACISFLHLPLVLSWADGRFQVGRSREDETSVTGLRWESRWHRPGWNKDAAHVWWGYDVTTLHAPSELGLICWILSDRCKRELKSHPHGAKKQNKKTCLLVNIDKLLYGYELWYSVWLWIVIFCISGFRSPVRRVWWLGANEYVKAACCIPLPANQGVTAPFCEGLGKVERHPVFVQTWRGPSCLVSISIYSISHSTHI